LFANYNKNTKRCLT